MAETPSLDSVLEPALKNHSVFVIPHLQLVSVSSTLLQEILVVDLNQDWTDLVLLAEVAIVNDFDQRAHLYAVHDLFQVGLSETANLFVKVVGPESVSVVEPPYDLLRIEDLGLPSIHIVLTLFVIDLDIRVDRVSAFQGLYPHVSHIYHVSRVFFVLVTCQEYFSTHSSYLLIFTYLNLIYKDIF